jgi:acetamidase/formamidase
MSLQITYRGRAKYSWSRSAKILMTVMSALTINSVIAEPAFDHYVKLTPENSVIGNFPAQKEAILTIKSGQTVKIDTGGGAGWRNPAVDPAEWLKANNIPTTVDNPAIKETIEVWDKATRYADIKTGHFLVGPINIEGAMPGDSLEIRILSVVPRIPYGTTGSGPGRSLRGSDGPKPPAHTTILDLKRNVGVFEKNIEVPLGPFMGVMGVQPAVEKGSNHSSSPPGDFGGNLDDRDLVAGTTLYLPVYAPGARFFTGDAHAAQGDGEITGTAIETANTLIATFILHKGKTLKMPRAETPTHYIAYGLDPDLENAMQQAVDETVSYINDITGWTGTEKALPLASISVDFHVTQIVDFTKGIHGKIPKSIFKDNKNTYWYKPAP